MIAYVNGELTSILDESIIIDVQGIGYEIFCPDPTVFTKYKQERVKVYTYHHVREDVQLLYGFKDKDEKYLFTKLISVSGIGPKSALAIMGAVHIPDFVHAIEKEDDKFLTSFPGVGKKTARQIILDLKGKLTSLLRHVDMSGEKVAQNTVESESLLEAQEALKALGYSDKEIKNIFPQLQKDQELHTDELIRKALALLTTK